MTRQAHVIQPCNYLTSHVTWKVTCPNESCDPLDRWSAECWQVMWPTRSCDPTNHLTDHMIKQSTWPNKWAIFVVLVLTVIILVKTTHLNTILLVISIQGMGPNRSHDPTHYDPSCGPTNYVTQKTSIWDILVWYNNHFWPKQCRSILNPHITLQHNTGTLCLCRYPSHVLWASLED